MKSARRDEVEISDLAVDCLDFKVPQTGAVRVLDGLVEPFLERSKSFFQQEYLKGSA